MWTNTAYKYMAHIGSYTFSTYKKGWLILLGYNYGEQNPGKVCRESCELLKDELIRQ